MDADLAALKQRLPLLQYLERRHWQYQRVGTQQEFVGLCPLHQETRPSFYVNARKNLFYCHGCGRGGDLIRFVELERQLSFRQSVAQLQQEWCSTPTGDLLQHTVTFYQQQLSPHPQAIEYLRQRALWNPELFAELRVGYAPGGNLRAHLTALGYSFALLLQTGLINHQGHDAFYRRVIFPCCEQGQISNLYGRSIGPAWPHRFLPRPRAGLFAWDSVACYPTVILVEGLFDLAVLWQGGFRNSTCAFGKQLTPIQFAQLCEGPDRLVYIAFDQDPNQAGQQAARALARRLQTAGVAARIVQLPAGHDPNSYFSGGATAADFAALLEQASSL
jgi:DNA primase catalytic core